MATGTGLAVETASASLLSGLRGLPRLLSVADQTQRTVRAGGRLRIYHFFLCFFGSFCPISLSSLLNRALAAAQVRRSLVLALGYNALAIPVAAGVLQSYGVAISPGAAALLMTASSLAVLGNSLALKRTLGQLA